MPSLFTRIIERSLPAWIVAEDDHHIAFLDIRPVQPGHTLVVPKKEVDYYFDLPDGELGCLNLFAKKVATALKAVVPCQRIGVMVFGLEVPHAHMHLIPIRTEQDMNFFASRPVVEKAEMERLATQIRDAWQHPSS